MNTQDLAQFGYRELAEAGKILTAYAEHGLEGFEHDEVRLEFNPNSGNVFLVNSEYQVAMLNGDKLELWLSCTNCDREGFLTDTDNGKPMFLQGEFESENECRECFAERKDNLKNA